MMVPMYTAIQAIQKDSFFAIRKAPHRPNNDKKMAESAARVARVKARLMAGEQLTIEQISIEEKFSRSHCGYMLEAIALEGLVEFVYIPYQAKTVMTKIKLYKLKADKVK